MDYEYEAKLVRVIDGDTIIFSIEKEYLMNVDFGFRIYDTISFKKNTTMTFRLYGIDTPEIIGEEKAAGLLAKEAVERLLSNTIKIRLVSLKSPDKYGRWLAKVYITQTEAPSIELFVNQWLVENGFAKLMPQYGIL